MKKYPKYKDSGIEWIGRIPEGWEVKRLRNISENVKTGSTPPSEEIIFFEPKDFNWFGPGDFDNLILSESKRKISNQAIKENKCRLFPPNSILLIGIGATVGKVGIVNQYCSSNQQINAIILNDEAIPKFYLYYLDSIKDIIVMEASSATLPIFNQTQTKNLVITYPTISEQNTIANYLDRKTEEINTLISNKEKLIELLKEERTAIINHAVTKGINPKVKMKPSGVEWIGDIPEHWEIGKLKYYCIKITDGSHISPASIDEGKRYISVKDVGQNFIDFENCKKISNIDFENLKRNGCQPSFEDILLTKDGTIGRATIVRENNDYVVLSSLGIISPDLSIMLSDYLREYLVSDLNVNQMLSLIQGSALTRITITIINNLKIVVPPLHEQVKIVEFLKNKTFEIDTIISKTEKEIELLNEYKTALISEVVTGKVDVREEVLV